LPAVIECRTAAKLTVVQEAALARAVLTLPDEWQVVVDTEDVLHDGDRFVVRILGAGFATVAGFAGATHPDQLSAFVERTRRGRQHRR
jgi:hypothetical protein